MTNECPNCGNPSEAAGRLCGDCIDECYWIVRPSAHRELARRRTSAMSAYFRRVGVEIITSYPDANDLWICDICNAAIVVTADIHLIPVVGTYALCPTCITGLTGWPYAFNPPRACPCDACSPERGRSLIPILTSETRHEL